MTELRVEPYTLLGADLGPENPLPMFRNPRADRKVDVEAHHIPPEDHAGLGWQTGWRILPYRMQDGYSRDKRPRDFFSVVLENEFLKLTVLPEVGGLAASIVHKPLNRELLYRNPVFQPGNLALRNAWISGGIEWNAGQLGHHWLTCSSLHAARVAGRNGEPVLRLCTWDRVKCFPYQIDLHLPADSAFLFARVRLINPHAHQIPMYWWTNMGVPEYPGGRVLCPADTAYKGATVVDCPVINGLDYSYATRINNAYDLFFRIPPGQRPWEAIVDRDGNGMIHTSTRRLRGRKMFAWGMGPGSRRWNEHLAVPDFPFQEIQAGLAPTQSHSVPMPAKTAWTWTEAYGYFESDPRRTHAPNWREACEEAERILEARLPAAEVDRLDAEFAAVTVRPPVEVLYHGLGWGALENRRAAAAGAPSGIPSELPFEAAELGAEQAPWLALLDEGALPLRSPQHDPGEYMIQREWQTLIEDGLEARKGDHWLTWLHLGIMRMEAFDTDGARAAWERSLEHAVNAWALRNLAVLESRKDNHEAACELLRRAWETGPPVAALAIEYGRALLRLGRYDALEGYLHSLPSSVASHERIELVGGSLALERGQFDEVERVLDLEFAMIREGEVALTDLWFDLQTKRLAAAENMPVDDNLKERVKRELPPPARIDFRMSLSPDDEYVPPQATGAPG